MSTPQQLPLLPLLHAKRSVVFNALFNVLKQCPSPTGDPWRTFSQRLQLWDQVPPGNQPALFLHRLTEIAEQKHAFGVTKWVYKCTIWVYFRTDNYKTDDRYPDQLVDQFLDGLEQLFQPRTQPEAFTLGGVCTNCWIDGTIFADAGIIDAQGVIIVPISIAQ